MKKTIYFLLLAIQPLWAHPKGFHAVAGDVKPPAIDAQGIMVIESGKSAIVEWESFCIGQGETVRFQQANRQAAIFNRVKGFSPSCIDGLLYSNGKVFLVNPRGVVVGSKGTIQTAAFLASTLDLSNDDFLQGRKMVFRGESREGVYNLGTIEASEGPIFLLGQKVKNEGQLHAHEGHIALGVGREIWIQPHEKQQIFIRLPIQLAVDEEEVPLQHSGTIKSLSAELQGGANPYEKAICCDGTIEAFSTKEEGGRIYLFAEEGRVDVSGSLTARREERGGEIFVLGREVRLNDQARVNASGPNGGGTIFVGGSYKGQDRTIAHALRTYIGPEVRLEADALTQGSGGDVIAWGDEALAYFGHISVRGSGQGGDGGFIEVSAPSLVFHGLTDRSAPQGRRGELLLDPINVHIFPNANTDSINVDNPMGAGEYTFTGCAPDPALIDITKLMMNLNSGDVTISTSAGSTSCGDEGNIEVSGSTPFAWDQATTLTLLADGSLFFDPGFVLAAGNSNSKLIAVADQASGSSAGPGGTWVENDGFQIAGQLWLYTSANSAVNYFPSTLNQALVLPAQEVYGVAYPAGTFVGPSYTVFFKTTPSTGSLQTQTVSTAAVAATSLSGILVSPASTSSSDVLQGPMTENQENPTKRENTNPTEASGVQTCE